LVGLYTGALKVNRGTNDTQLQAREVNGQDYFDISLPSIDDKDIRLSYIGKGKVVLLDFTAYELKDAPLHNRSLNEAYAKYKSQGFEIFQVSLDADKHFWKNAAVNLPWICVIDPQSVYSETAKRFNVKDIPLAFIFDRKGEIVERIEQFDDLDKIIVKYLK
jgi:peroxiredoxin